MAHFLKITKAAAIFASICAKCPGDTTYFTTASSTVTVTVTSFNPASTSYKFLSGNPPGAASFERREPIKSVAEDTLPVGYSEPTYGPNYLNEHHSCTANDPCLQALRSQGPRGVHFCTSYTSKLHGEIHPAIWIPKECSPPMVVEACSCLQNPTPRRRSTSISTTICHSAAGSTTKVASSPTPPCSCPPTRTTTSTILNYKTVTKTKSLSTIVTVYPCADPLPSPGPAYGDASSPVDLAGSNSLLYINTPEGASAKACCNRCFFEIPNCIQAYWYSYEGCVISQATNMDSASGEGISEVCPAGTFKGLTYGPNVKPAFHSTGNIAGPCGQKYQNSILA